jgi:hypothetical protein
VLPLLARYLMKWWRGMSFIVTPSLVSTCSAGRTTTQGWCRWLLAWLDLLSCLLLSPATLPPAARCAACLHYSTACYPCCCYRWLCCHCHFDCWMLLFFYSGSTTPQLFVEMLQQRRTRCPPLGPVQAATLLLARCSLKFLNHGQ